MSLLSRNFINPHNAFVSRYPRMVPNTLYASRSMVLKNNVTFVKPKIDTIAERLESVEQKVQAFLENTSTTNQQQNTRFMSIETSIQIINTKISDLPDIRQQLANIPPQPDISPINQNIQQLQLSTQSLYDSYFRNVFLQPLIDLYTIKGTFSTSSPTSAGSVIQIQKKVENRYPDNKIVISEIDMSSTPGNFITIDPAFAILKDETTYLYNDTQTAYYWIKPRWQVSPPNLNQNSTNPPVSTLVLESLVIPTDKLPFYLKYRVTANIVVNDEEYDPLDQNRFVIYLRKLSQLGFETNNNISISPDEIDLYGHTLSFEKSMNGKTYLSLYFEVEPPKTNSLVDFEYGFIVVNQSTTNQSFLNRSTNATIVFTPIIEPSSISLT